MNRNERTKFTPFQGSCHRAKEPDSTETVTIPIETDAVKDSREVTKNASRSTQQESKARSSRKHRRHFGNGDDNENNFGGDIVNNYGNVKGNIFKGKNAAKNSGNTNGSIICDETSTASNDEDWEDFGNGKNNSNNFGGRVVNNLGGKPKGKN